MKLKSKNNKTCADNCINLINYLSSKYSIDSADLEQIGKDSFLMEIPTSHTWGLRHWRSNYNSDREFLYEKILLDDEALLSYRRRAKKEKHGAFTLSTEAKSIGYDDYIFAYLGVHEPKYAHLEYPAFGVFIRKNIEAKGFSTCRASYRNFASPEITSRKEDLKINLLLPEDARRIACIESFYDPRHSRDPWQYWSAYQYYSNQSWEWKIEFHYKGKIDIDDFAAILWPTEVAELSDIRGKKVNSKLNVDAIDFQTKHPNCKVIEYRYEGEDPEMNLICASSFAAKYFVDKGEFPGFVTK